MILPHRNGTSSSTQLPVRQVVVEMILHIIASSPNPVNLYREGKCLRIQLHTDDLFCGFRDFGITQTHEPNGEMSLVIFT